MTEMLAAKTHASAIIRNPNLLLIINLLLQRCILAALRTGPGPRAVASAGDQSPVSIYPNRQSIAAPRTVADRAVWLLPYVICLDTYILNGVYKESGIRVRNHCGAEPPRDLEPAGLVATVGGRDRASASYAAADGVQAPAGAARGRLRRIHGGCTAPSLPSEAGTTA